MRTAPREALGTHPGPGEGPRGVRQPRMQGLPEGPAPRGTLRRSHPRSPPGLSRTLSRDAHTLRVRGVRVRTGTWHVFVCAMVWCECGGLRVCWGDEDRYAVVVTAPARDRRASVIRVWVVSQTTRRERR